MMDRENEQDISLDQVMKEIEGIETKEGIAAVSSRLFNALMEKEREIHLRTASTNKANGFYKRQLTCALGNLGLTVPRDRENAFRPSVLPEAWQRSDESYQELLLNLVMNSYSPNKIKSLLADMGLPYSPEQLEEIKDELLLKAKELRTRDLPHNTCCLYIDAYHTDLKDPETAKVRKAVIYSILGIDLTGMKDVYGYYIFFDHETKEDWLTIFNDLIVRGLKRVMLIVSDDFSGLAHAIAALFPHTNHQLCFIHMQRNVRRNMAKPDTKEMNDELTLMRKGKAYDQAIPQFEKLCQKYHKKYPHFIECLLQKKELYFSFLKFPEAIRKHIYTTNMVENVNSRLEVIRVNAGGYFQSHNSADMAIYVLMNHLRKKRWKKPIPAFREAQYELNQLFHLKFNHAQTQFS